MHGGGDDENYWLMELSDRTHGKTTMRVLDHMIEDGLCEPLIVVTPTFYADVEGVEPTHYGHFGNRPYTRKEKVWEDGREVEREIEFFGWEKLDAVDLIKQKFGL